MTTQRDIRKSSFVAVDTAVSTDRFDFVRGSQNLAITLENLVASMGVSGVLMTAGEATAIPVLSVVAGVNYIRGIYAGPGINTTLSPSNAVQVGHNFTVDKSGVPIMINEGASSPTIRSITAGSGISVAGAGDTVQITASEVPESTKTVNVYELDDLPTPVAGVITFEDETEYRFLNTISGVNRYVMGSNTVLTGSDAYLIELEYTGSGNMFTAVDVSFKIQGLHLICTSGTMLDVSSTTGLHEAQFLDLQAEADNAGTFDNLSGLRIYASRFTFTTQGFEFANNFQTVLIDTVSIIIASGTGNGFTLGTATFDYINFIGLLTDIDTTGYVVSGLADSGNINAGGLGSAVLSRNYGSCDASDNISPYDNLWESALNAKLENSYNLALATHGGGTITISAAATPVIIGATWTEIDTHRFTITSGGRFTYTGKGDHISISVSIAASIALATDNCTYFLYLNGVQISGSSITRAFSAGSVGNIMLIWDLIVETGDYIEVWGQNDDATVNLIIDKIIFRAN